MPDDQPTKACPWCGETILAVAKKCKHCGEYLVDETGPSEPAANDSAFNPLRCNQCGFEAASMIELNDHYERTIGDAHHEVPELFQAARGPFTTRGQRISVVGKRTDAGLACPRCGGTQFKVKRSGRAKFVAVTVTPLSLFHAGQVKCVTCGTIFKRG